MNEPRVVDFAPGCECELLGDGPSCHGIWPHIQGRRAWVHRENITFSPDSSHNVWAYVECTDPLCTFGHRESEELGYGRAHRQYLKPDELRFTESPDHPHT